MKHHFLFALASLALATSAGHAQSGVIADYRPPGEPALQPVTPYDHAYEVTASAFQTHGSVLYNNGIWVRNFPTALDLVNYIGFLVEAEEGQTITLTHFQHYSAVHPSLSQITGFRWGYRVDNGSGFGAWVFDKTYLPSDPGFTDSTILKAWDFADFPVTGKVEFGLFAAQAASITTGALINLHYPSSNNGLQVHGSVSHPIPEDPSVPVAAMGVQPLSHYAEIVTHRLDPDLISEASAVTYNWDTDTLFVIGDEGEALTQITRTGEIIDRLRFAFEVSPRANRPLDDPEGLAYLGKVDNGNSVVMIADERRNRGVVVSYIPNPIPLPALVKADLDPTSYVFGPDTVGNSGLEGVAYDPVEKTVWGLQETAPVKIYKMAGVPQIRGNAGVPLSVIEPIPQIEINRWSTRPLSAPMAINQVSDIYALAASQAFPEGHPRRLNLLVLARERRMIFEVDRNGKVIDKLDISAIGRGTIEGIAVGSRGEIYLVSEQTIAPNNFSGLHVLMPPPAPGIVDHYTSAATHYFEGQWNLAEASGITYNWDTDSLFVVEDEGNAVIQIDKRGRVLNTMALQGGSRPQRALDDPEGIAYLGEGEFMFADERDNVGRIGTYDPLVTRTQAELAATAYAFGPATGNTGLEGVASDPLTNSVWGVQENPFKLYKMLFGAEAGSLPVVTEPLAAELAEIAQEYGVTALSDIVVLASSEAYAANEHLLLLARDQKLILEIDRFGRLIATLNIGNLGRNKIEGMTMDDDGVLYLVSEREEGGTSIHDGRGALHVLTLPKHGVTGTGRGRATLAGTAGDDEIYGNPAADTLTGGQGKDTFVFKTLRDGPDTITDFTPGEDKIDVGALLDSLAYTGLNPLQDALQDGTVRVITSSAGPLVQIRSSGSYRALAQLSSGVTLAQANRPENFLFKTHKMPAPLAAE